MTKKDKQFFSEFVEAIIKAQEKALKQIHGKQKSNLELWRENLTADKEKHEILVNAYQELNFLAEQTNAERQLQVINALLGKIQEKLIKKII